MFIYLYIFSFLVLLKIARWPQKPNSSEPRTKINSICSWITTENARRAAEREKREESVCVGRWEKLIKNYAIFYLAWNTLRMRNVNAWNWTDRNCLYDSVCVTVRLNVCVSVFNCECVPVCLLYCVWLSNRLIVSATITFLITSALKFQQQNIAESH